MMKSAVCGVRAALIRLPLLAEHKLGLACKTSKALESFVIFFAGAAIRADASCSRLYESHGCKKNGCELFGQRQPSAVGRTGASHTRLQIVEIVYRSVFDEY